MSVHRNKQLFLMMSSIFMLSIVGCVLDEPLPTPTPSKTLAPTATHTPPPTVTYTPSATSTPSLTPTPVFPPIQDFTGTWNNINPNHGTWNTIEIEIGGKSGDRLLVQIWAKCWPKACYMGRTSAKYTGNPVEVYYDQGGLKYVFVLVLDGDTLHVTSSGYYFDEMGTIPAQPDWMYEDNFRKK